MEEDNFEEGKEEKPEISNSSPSQTEKGEVKKEEKTKKSNKIILNFILLIVFLAILGLIAYYFSLNIEELSSCENSQCGIYQVASFSGPKYICANEDIAEEDSIKNKLSLMKYSFKKGNQSELDCNCFEGLCEAE